MVEKTVVITNPEGLHARPAALFVQTAGKLLRMSGLRLGKQSKCQEHNGTYISGCCTGTEVVIGAEGEDEEKLWKSLLILLQQVLRRINSKKQIDKIENIDKPYKIGILVLIFDMVCRYFFGLITKLYNIL